MQKIIRQIAAEIRVQRAAGPGRRGPSRRRGHGALRRALPQGGHRRPRRHPVARARTRGWATCASWKTGARPCSRASTSRASSRPQLRAAIEAAPTKQELEDLYLPYKPKRRTKGQIAREAGIEPLADRLFADPSLDPAAGGGGFRQGGKGRGRRGFHHRGGGARRRARHPVGALGRAAGAGGPAARMAVVRRAVQGEAHGRQGREPRRRGEIPRLLRLRRADRPGSFAPRAGGVPRPAAGDPRRQAGPAGRAGAGPALDRRRQDRAAPGLEPPGPRRATT